MQLSARSGQSARPCIVYNPSQLDGGIVGSYLVGQVLGRDVGNLVGELEHEIEHVTVVSAAMRPPQFMTEANRSSMGRPGMTSPCGGSCAYLLELASISRRWSSIARSYHSSSRSLECRPRSAHRPTARVSVSPSAGSGCVGGCGRLDRAYGKWRR